MSPAFSAAWQMTRNTYEAAALASLRIGVQPVTMRKHDSTSHDITEWNLQPGSVDEHGRPDGKHITGQLRRDFNGGKLQGIFLTETLHPYLIALRSMHNRQALLRCMKGEKHYSYEAAPCSWELMPGTAKLAHTGATIDTTDIDLAVALITIGCYFIGFSGSEHACSFKLSRLALPSRFLPDAPRIDGGQLMLDYRAGLIFPARKDEPFANALHALHALRELRKHQHTTRFIIISHKTPRHRGAAFNDKAQGDVIQTVRRTLGTRL